MARVGGEERGKDGGALVGMKGGMGNEKRAKKYRKPWQESKSGGV